MSADRLLHYRIAASPMLQDFGVCKLLDPGQTHVSNFKNGCANNSSTYFLCGGRMI